MDARLGSRLDFKPGKSNMAKTTTKSGTHAITHTRTVQPIVVRPAVAPAKHGKGKGHHRRHHVSAEKALMGFVIGGFALGWIDKSATAIPTIPILGKAGTIAVAAHFFGKGKPGLVTDLRNAAAVVAAYEYGSTGKIAGDDDDDAIRPQRPRAPLAHGHV
jgi:hypothetical protein